MEGFDRPDLHVPGGTLRQGQQLLHLVRVRVRARVGVRLGLGLGLGQGG